MVGCVSQVCVYGCVFCVTFTFFELICALPMCLIRCYDKRDERVGPTAVSAGSSATSKDRKNETVNTLLEHST